MLDIIIATFAIIGFATTVISVTVVFVLCFKKTYKDLETHFTPLVPDASLIDKTIAVHESGHLIAAWFCSGVKYVKYIYKTNIVGEVTYAFRGNTFEKCSELWSMAVIGLAGIAAEIIVLKKMRASNCDYDLIKARKLIDEILIINPSWKQNYEINGQLPFNEMFKTNLSYKEEKLFKLAYKEAKDVIKKHHDDFDRIVNLLLEHKNLTQEQLESVLPRRFIMNILSVFNEPKFL